MQDDPVTYADSLPHMTGNALINVHDGPILNIRLGTDDNRRHVTPEHGPIPDARFLAQRHVSHDGCSRSNEGCGMNRRRAHAARYWSRAGGNNI
jgi:hypothetical protein